MSASAAERRVGPALVTGASGFIGSALVASLRALGRPVFVVDLEPFPDPSVPGVVGDLRDPAVLANAMACEPSAIFHLAARTSVLRSKEDPAGVFDVNVAVTQHLLEAARRQQVSSFVFASSNAVAGETEGARIDERTPMHPLTPYGATKAAAEMLCSAYANSYGISASSIRFTNVYGYGMGRKDTFVVRLLRAAARGAPVEVYGDGLQERDYLFVDDAVAGLLRAEQHGLTGALTIGTGTSTSVLGVCQAASEVLGQPIELVHVEPPAGEMRAVRVDISRAESLGYAPTVDLRHGLEMTWTALSPVLIESAPAG
jgi:UDP-glucose 4-epimerase